MSEPLLAPMPQSLDLQPNYTLRVVALDPTTGSAVTGVTIGTVVITADNIAGVEGGGVVYGDWFLVPGPGA